MNNNFSDRLKFFRSQKNLSQQALANAVGISRKQVSDYEVGSAKPRQATYFKILDALGLTDEDFTLSKVTTQSESPLVLKIPVYNWVSVMSIRSTSPDSHIYIDSKILQRTSIDGLFALSIGGMSMHPYYKDGDSVIVDSNMNTIRDGFLYILSMNNYSSIKQCFKQPDGKIQLSAFHSDYPSFWAEESEISVIGEVIFKMGFA